MITDATLLQWQCEAVTRSDGDWCLFNEVSRLRALMPARFARLPAEPAERVIQLWDGLEPARRFVAAMPYLGGHHGELYQAYLQTPHWRAFRAHIVSKYDGWCPQCRQQRQLDVHHLHYETLGMESANDVRVLCHECHEKEHGREW